ncbi:MAG: type II secretion system protein [Fibrobacter sp.]|jgi:Tfp pilus assembly protein PilV|uniref:type IV pilus modification PilV family protein n=1 Tax=Fibrobacter sp. TaxID=35828 RepID=UPI001B120A63|nr:type II secretion system protein [Fibrobacter sp.]MBO7061874.1 type II secretion system protein [Fibrobacter sp.]MBR3668742.1 type II secretion system protein [Fibrobacter sp.]
MLAKEFRKKLFGNRSGFGIVEVLISAAVLGFLYLALLHMQVGNREALLRIRGRDGAVEVAQNIIDSLKTVGVASITSFSKNDIVKSWDRGTGGSSTVTYKADVTVGNANEYKATTKSNYDPNIEHVYAKQVDVKVSWNFKGSEQSVNVSSVVR